MSAAGDALQMLPASVARFRIWTAPTTAAASASACVVTPDPLVAQQVGHHGPRADREMPVGLPDAPLQLGDALDVDHGARLDRAVPDADDQVGATGEKARVGPLIGEQADGLGQFARPLVGERTHGSGPTGPDPPGPGPRSTPDRLDR